MELSSIEYDALTINHGEIPFSEINASITEWICSKLIYHRVDLQQTNLSQSGSAAKSSESKDMLV